MATFDEIAAGAQVVLFYDGDCGLCHRCVAWASARDRHGRVRFAPLQGETYASLEVARPTDLSTLVALDRRGVHVLSGAVVSLLRAIGGIWSIAGAALRLVPPPLRDFGYRFVARRRLGWFGPADRCSLPGDADRFLP